MNFPRPPSKFHTLLVLGRVSNLPTVWSNCLAGWWLAGAGPWWRWLLLCLAATLLYLGGMFLNDAFDASFDRRNRRSRPIPSGAISEKETWQWGFCLLALGAAGLIWAGATAAVLTVLLTGFILLYNLIHEWAVASPLLLGACRLCLYLVSASLARDGVSGQVVWCGLALAAYVMGLSWLARKEIGRGPAPYWPGLLLAAPLVLAGLMDDGWTRQTGNLLSLFLLVWMLWALRQAFWRAQPMVDYAVARLLAGIPLVDLLAVADLTRPQVLLFPIWFALALLLQHYIPAT
ncbi:MAG TPA: UbiA family prenyltransferase [Candidatus Acidoferrum sp.]|nr:UbiA family prenyltransferase [Candidatus Acidoferrum sp.]